MKVVQVIDQLEVGGAESVFVNLSNICYENNITVSVLCLLNKSKLDSSIHPKIPITYLKRKNKFSIVKLYKLHVQLKKYDIVHVHCRQVLRYVGLLYFIPFCKKHKIVFHDHYGKIETDKSLDFLLTKILAKIEAYIGVSDTLVQWFSDKITHIKSFLLGNIVRTRNFKQDKDKTRGHKILMIGNFRAQKNYMFALKVLEKLPEQYTLTIIGKAIDKAYYQKVSKQINLRHLTHRVFIRTNVDDAATYINHFDFALHTATSETGPLVALEYLQYKLPFLMFDTGQVAKEMHGTLSELILDDFKADHWVKKLLLLEKRYINIQQKMQEKSESAFSESAYISNCKKIYKAVLL